LILTRHTKTLNIEYWLERWSAFFRYLPLCYRHQKLENDKKNCWSWYLRSVILSLKVM